MKNKTITNNDFKFVVPLVENQKVHYFKVNEEDFNFLNKKDNYIPDSIWLDWVCITIGLAAIGFLMSLYVGDINFLHPDIPFNFLLSTRHY